MNNSSTLFLLLCLIFLSISCLSPSPSLSSHTAFYHWQTQLSVDSLEQQWLQESQAQRMYVKFFDVDWDYNQQAAVPKATLIVERPPQGVEIIPTVFITNRCFQEITGSQISALAAALVDKIRSLWPELHPSEIQIDCDWTQSTQVAYFRFLEHIKTLIPATTTLSVTIRLHQYRYPEQTGIPPVDRGILMYYNMGDLSDWTEPNSILNLDKAAPYLDADAYTIPLDLALPLFRWGVLFREGRMIKLINNLRIVDLQTDKVKLLKEEIALGSSRWLVTEDHYLNGYYLYAGDQIRLEYITKELLKKAALQLQQISQKEDRYLSFYHLDQRLFADTDYDVFDLAALRQILSP